MAGPSVSRRALIATAAVAAAIFGILAIVVAYHPEPFGVDRAVATIAADVRADWLTPIMKATSIVGAFPSIAIQIAVAGGLILFLRRRAGPALWLLAAAVGCWLLSNGFKAFLDRPRPEDGLVGTTGTAFPSGHATQGGGYFVMLAVVLVAVTPRPWRWVAAGAAVAVGVLSGLSRIYLGVHWATDVVGGFALGLAWTTMLLALRPRAEWDVPAAG